MEIPELTIKLIIILLPGALATKIYKRLTTHKTFSDFDFVVDSILFGVFSYTILQLVRNAFQFLKNVCTGAHDGYIVLGVWEKIADKQIIPYQEVLWASVISLCVAYLCSWIDTQKIVNKLAHSLSVSNKYGDEGLFSYYMNSEEVNVIYVRCPKTNLTYYGIINTYSETETISELVLREVSVYSYDESELLYEIPTIYLALAKGDVIIEQATLPQP